ncbi:MAG TPA: DUF4253 domain-containing protein [Candidatus Limnocylindria bacterium]|jgi:hypothetical protein|nr:DUF4253 domain-containing protein [Candidatus Limnocylindria bacterium]
MTPSLSKVLAANGLSPNSFFASASNEKILEGELPAGRVVETWVKLAGAASETGYWPIIRGSLDDVYEPIEGDADAILAAVPTGSIREILKPRFEERRESLSEIASELARAIDMDELGKLADIEGINLFGGYVEEPWPTDIPEQVSFHTVRELKGQPASALLVRVEHSYEVAAHLGFGGWNDCPSSELQVAAMREWYKKYRAVPACITGDVLECAVMKPPQTEAEALKLAAEHWIFCDDIVGQGTQTVRKLAMEIWRSPNWFFWWD